MGKTLAEQILSHAAGVDAHTGDLVIVKPELVMSHDSLSTSIIQVMREELGVRDVYDARQLVMVFDHVVPAATVGVANSQKQVRLFAREQGIKLFDVGSGVCHQVLVEHKLAQPGMVIVGADSHSTSYGSVGAFGTGMGTTDVALIWATGRTWMRVPHTIRVDVTGRFPRWITPKDLALKLCKEITISGANYASVEYHGLDWMPLPGRQTLASMAVEMGAKAGIIPPFGELQKQFNTPDWLKIDKDAQYAGTYSVNLDQLEPQVSLPLAVDNVVDISKFAGTPVNEVFLGTCTNGRYEDMKIALEVLNGRHVADTVRLIVTPASQHELQRAIGDGTLSSLIEAGAVVSTPGCGACMGRHMGALGDEDVCLSTGNRNFKGRMGAPTSQIYLASPAVAAATAATGCITDPRNL